MPAIVRYTSPGTVEVPNFILDDLDYVLALDTAASPAHVQAAITDLAAPAVHDYLTAEQVDVLQRLRCSAAASGTTASVDAALLANARNILDLETYTRTECHHLQADLLDETRANPDDQALVAEHRAVKAAAAEDTLCGRCEFCHALALRDVLDELLDQAGADGGPQYEAHVRANRPADAISFWRTHIYGVPSNG